MNAPRIIWRRACAVRLPNRIDTPPHVELFQARQLDKLNSDIEECFEYEVERALEEVRS